MWVRINEYPMQYEKHGLCAIKAFILIKIGLKLAEKINQIVLQVASYRMLLLNSFIDCVLCISFKFLVALTIVLSNEQFPVTQLWWV